MAFKEGAALGFNKTEFNRSINMLQEAKEEIRMLPLSGEVMDQVLDLASRIAEGVRRTGEVIHHPASRDREMHRLLAAVGEDGIGTNEEFKQAQRQFNLVQQIFWS